MSETSPQHIPVVQKLKNVWITDAEADRITIFCDGEKETFFLEAETEGSDSVPAPEQMREQLADVELTDELVSAVVLKTDKFTGRVLSANENGIEIEGRGRIPLAEDYKGYRLYRELTMCTFADLTFGYANADFIQENGEICGILLAREANMEDIRVLIKTSDYCGYFAYRSNTDGKQRFPVAIRKWGKYTGRIVSQRRQDYHRHGQ